MSFNQALDDHAESSSFSHSIARQNFYGHRECPVSYTHLTLPTILLV